MERTTHTTTGSGSDRASEEARRRLEDTADETRERIHDVAGTAREKGREVGARAGEDARRMAEERRNRTAERAHRVADALRSSATTFRERDESALGGLSERAADRLDGFADHLRDNSVGDLMSEAEDVARRHPSLFLGGAFLAGAIVGRFLHSSTPSDGSEHEREGRARLRAASRRVSEQGAAASPRGGGE